MKAYLIECGNHYIIYIKETKQYYFISDNMAYLEEFTGDNPQFEKWPRGHFLEYELGTSCLTDNTKHSGHTYILGNDISEETILAKFIDPVENPGSVVAMRNTEDNRPTIYDKKKFLNITSN